jgi:uncharacterized protein YecE (DUF72 family)
VISQAIVVGPGLGSDRFAVKASRYLTHMKKLSDPEAPRASFLGRTRRRRSRRYRGA